MSVGEGGRGKGGGRGTLNSASKLADFIF